MKNKKHYHPLYQLTKKVFADCDTQAGRFEWYLIIAIAVAALIF